jgi:hypothetical protein
MKSLSLAIQKDMANVRIFADRQRDKTKTICPRSFDTGA